ncbi:MAG: helix-turn-helix domain-containing protein [Candidatus Aminicenantes bacterium]|nr:helix-turn-helix domain-containing protein [Candidatus Aminicenantes bacterium]
MRVSFDRKANAAYIKISDSSIKETKEISDYCNVDIDANGKIVGVELLFVSEYSVDFRTWLDIASVAEYLQKSEVTIRRWTKAKELPSYKIGGEYRFIKEEIDEYIKGKKYA